TWQGEPERALGRLQSRLEQTLKLGAGNATWLLFGIAFAESVAGRPEQARDRLEGLVPLVEGRDAYITSWALCLLAESQRLLGDAAAEATALRAQESGERLDNRLLATRARVILGRLAAARGDWAVAQEHVLAHLDACAEGGHACFTPDCLDALGEVAAGLQAERDAVRLLAAAQRARVEMGRIRSPPAGEHWAAAGGRLRGGPGAGAYEGQPAEGGQRS